MPGNTTNAVSRPSKAAPQLVGRCAEVSAAPTLPDDTLAKRGRQFQVRKTSRSKYSPLVGPGKRRKSSSFRSSYESAQLRSMGRSKHLTHRAQALWSIYRPRPRALDAGQDLAEIAPKVGRDTLRPLFGPRESLPDIRSGCDQSCAIPKEVWAPDIMKRTIDPCIRRICARPSPKNDDSSEKEACRPTRSRSVAGPPFQRAHA